MRRWTAALLALILSLTLLAGCKGGEEPLTNLFQPGEEGMALDANGQKIESYWNHLSEPIAVKEGDRIFLGPVFPAQSVLGYCFDKSGAPLALINASLMEEEAELPGGWKIYCYTIPKNGAEILLNVSVDMADYMVVSRNNSLSLEELEQLSGVPADYFGDCLYGKQGLFVGDSICAGGSGGWAARIGISTGMNATNNAVGGASLSICREALIVDQLWVSKEEDFDYVLIHGGVNDAWENVEVGVLTEGFDPDLFDITTFAGGLEWVIYNAVLHFGNTASIGYLINYQMPAAVPGRCADMSEYIEIAKKICDKWGISCFDMYHHEEITKELDLSTTKHTYDTKNMVHISDSGYDVISPFIEEYMRGMKPCGEAILKEILKD